MNKIDATTSTRNGLFVTRGDVPALFIHAGEEAANAFETYFNATLDNSNTQNAYFHAWCRFSDWCVQHQYELTALNSRIISDYKRELDPGGKRAVTTVKQHLSALSKLFDFLVTDQILPFNPSSSVSSPKQDTSEGSTPALNEKQLRLLFSSIDVSTIWGLRNRALMAVMLYSCARVSAVVGMKLSDYFMLNEEWYFRLHEKRSKVIIAPVHPLAQQYVDEYIDAVGIRHQPELPLFRKLTPSRELTTAPMSRQAATSMIADYCQRLGFKEKIGSHSFRASGITISLKTVPPEDVQQLTGHKDINTTMRYDRRKRDVKKKVVQAISIAED